MVQKLTYIYSDSYNPYANQALEEYLLWNVAEDECILYLWQNRRTIVIGVNQNPWKECRIKALEDDEGFLARRLSGGGAVFHDFGNLNFTFLVRTPNYDLERQLEVIKQAVRKFGIDAEKSGRNDILADGRKFSGNAFYNSSGHSYHHGTLLVDSDMSQLSHYLSVSPAKLKSKGVNSVRSRVVNLKELAPAITIDSLKQRLTEAFGEVYWRTPQIFAPERIVQTELNKLEEKYSSWQWRLGRRLPFSVEYANRFDWGDFTLQLCVESGYIKDSVAYSDGMDTDYISAIGAAMKGVVFSSVAVKCKLLELAETINVPQNMLDDILSFVEEQNF